MYASYLFSVEYTTLPLVGFQTGPPGLRVTAPVGLGSRIPVDPGWPPPTQFFPIEVANPVALVVVVGPAV